MGSKPALYEIQSYQLSTVRAYLEWAQGVHNGLNRAFTKTEIAEIQRGVGVLFATRATKPFSTPDTARRHSAKVGGKKSRPKSRQASAEEAGEEASEKGVVALTIAEAQLLASGK